MATCGTQFIVASMSRPIAHPTLLFALVSLVAFLGSAEAQTAWSSTPTTGVMTNAANWSGGVAPADNTSWVFTNSSIVALTNGFSNYTVAGILFTTNASAYGISGSNFTLTGGITNFSTVTQIISNNLAINSSVTLTNAANSSSSFIQLSGSLSGNGTITYGAANNGGRLVLQSGNNTNFSGALIATSGRVNLGSSNSVSANADYTFNNSGGAFLVTANQVYNFGSLSGSAAIAVNSVGTTNTISVGAKNSSTTFSGNISTNQNGTINVIKVGSGTLTLSSNNAYIGSTTISNGVLQIGAGGTIGSISNTASITLAGGSLAFNRSDNVAQGVNFTSAALTGTGGFIQMGAGTTTLTAANTFSGDTVASAGALRLSNSAAIQNSALSLSGGALLFDASLTTSTFGGLKGSGNLALTNGSGGTVALTLNVGGTATNSGIISGTGASITKTGAGTQTLSGNNSYSSGTTLNSGTLGVGHSSALGSGVLTVGGTSTLLAAADTLNLANNISLSSGALTVDVSGFTLTNSGAITGVGALTKIGAGSLTITGANSYSGGTLVTAGTLIGNTGALQGSITNNAAIVFDQSSAGTYGGVLSGSGNLTKLGSGTLILDAANTQSGGALISAGVLQIGNGGTTGSLAGLITNNATLAFNRSDNLTQSAVISGTGSLTKSGNGTLTLGVNNNFSGKTTINAGSVAIAADARLGTAPGSLVSDQLTLNGGTLATTASFTLNTNRGVTLGAAGGSISIGAGTVLTITNSQQTVSGSGSLTKLGTGTLALGGSNNFSGGTLLDSGTLRLQASSVISGDNIIAGALGVGNVTINGGLIQGNSHSLYATNFTINGDFAVNTNSYSSAGNGRATLGGLFDMGGATRTIALGRWTNALGAITGGQESLRFGNSTVFNANYTNGSLRFVRDSAGTASDFVAVNFTIAGQKFSGGGGFVIGSNVIATFGSGSAFTNSTGVLPTLTMEEGGYFNLGSSVGASSQSIRSLSGTAGTVTSLGTNATASTATLTISNLAGDSTAFAGRIMDGYLLTNTLGTVSSNISLALSKSGAGTQILSGSNNYAGTTRVDFSGGLLQFAKTASLYNGSSASWTKTSITVNSGGTIGFNVGGTGEFSTSDVDAILTGLGGSISNNGLRGGSKIAFDTANAAGGSFSITNIVANSTGTGSGSVGITKLGANTLTLSGANTFTGALDVQAGTLELVSTSGAAAGSASSVSIASSAVLLVSQSDQLNNNAAVTLSGGTIARGSGVSEVFGNLNINGASFLDFGSGASGTLQFQAYANTGSALVAVQNFLPGNKLQFTSSSFNAGSMADFNFGTADFSTGIEGNYFTITAIPEPYTIISAIGLLGLFGWQMVRRRTRI
jgi:fibronectin-binding autotransporter adhesin